MPLSPFSLISQEIIDEIIDCLLDSEGHFWYRRSLLACALVCRAFRARAQRHLFKAIGVGVTTRLSVILNRQRLEDLSEILRDVRIASYVENINLSFDPTTLWPTEDRSFANAMDSISNSLTKRPRTLAFKISTDFYPQQWPFVHHHEHGCLNRFTLPGLSPFITELSLTNVKGLCVNFLTDCRQLKELDLWHTTFETTFLKPTPYLRPRPQRLELLYEFEQTQEQVCNAVELLLEGLDFSDLRALYFSFDVSESPDILKRLLAASANSLQELSFSFCDSSNRFSNIYDLSRLPNLTELFVKDISMDFLEFDPLKDLCNFFGTISGSNMIRKIWIALIGPPEDGEDIGLLQRLDQSDWEAFDDLLIKLSHGERLDVDMSIYYIMPSYVPNGSPSRLLKTAGVEKELDEALVTWPKRKLPRATEASQIALEFSWSIDF